VRTMVLPRVALTAEEVAAAAGQQATVFQELASALVEIRQPILGFPSAQALRRFFAARREFITDGLVAYDSGKRLLLYALVRSGRHRSPQ
jgi:hypothetical protein